MSTLLLCVFFAVSASANDVEVDGLYYNLNKTEKTAEVTCEEAGEAPCSGSFEIPSSILINEEEYIVTSIGDYAFQYSPGLTSITIPNSVTSIGKNAFYDCSGLTSITIPNSVTSIGNWAFGDCSGLTSVTIPNSVTSIGSYAFSHCSGLTSITIPNSVTSIGDFVLDGCDGIKNPIIVNDMFVYLPQTYTGHFSISDNVTTIIGGAFYDCSGLTSITIPNSVKSIRRLAFEGCTGLTSITIPNSVTSIKTGTFLGCTSLTSITIPNSVTSIGEWAFQDCTGLTSITIPNSVTSIGYCAFLCCTGLTSITIPNSVTSIEGGAFSDCTSLTSITIPNSVTSIEYEAFSGCKNIGNVYCYAATVPSTETDAFKEAYIEYATLHVPESAINAYKTTEPWSAFGTFKTLEGTGVEKNNAAKTRGVVIQSAAGFITISGLDSTEQVDFYASDGKALGSAKAMGGTATFAAQSGSVVVAKIGKESVKIAVK